MLRIASIFLLVLLLGGVFPALSTRGEEASVADLLPESLPFSLACFQIDNDGSFDSATVAARLGEFPNAAKQLRNLGWNDGAFRQYVCDDPPAGHINWVEVDVHRFKDPASAATAVLYFASARALATRLDNVAASGLGDTSAALTGPSVTGTEYTLYISSGPLLLRVTGLSPDGDPAPEVRQIARTWLSSRANVRTIHNAPTSTTPAPSTSAVPSLPSYSILDLGAGVSPTLITDQGQVLIGSGQRQLLWDDGTATDVATYGLESVLDITSDGFFLATQEGRSVLFDPASGTSTPIAGFEGRATFTAVNEAGDAIGQKTFDVTRPGEVGQPVMIIDDEAIKVAVPPGCDYLRLTEINNAGVVAGETSFCLPADPLAGAVIYSNGELTPINTLPGSLAYAVTARDINDLGQLVGDPGVCPDCGTPSEGHAYLYDPSAGTVQDLGTLPGHENSLAFAINNTGEVVGLAWFQTIEDLNGNGHAIMHNTAYIYDTRSGEMTDLNEVTPPNSGWHLTAAYDINDARQIVGIGEKDGEPHGYLLTPVP